MTNLNKVAAALIQAFKELSALSPSKVTGRPNTTAAHAIAKRYYAAVQEAGVEKESAVSMWLEVLNEVFPNRK